MTNTMDITTSNGGVIGSNKGILDCAFVCVAAEAADCGGGAIASDGW